MSLRAMLWALSCPAVESATDALVLLALAEHVGSDVDAVAWPSAGRLARYARCDERTVRRSLDRLRAAGVIEPGPAELAAYIRPDRRPNVWRLLMSPQPVDAAGHGGTLAQAGGHSAPPSAPPHAPDGPETRERHAATGQDLRGGTAPDKPLPLRGRNLGGPAVPAAPVTCPSCRRLVAAGDMAPHGPGVCSRPADPGQRARALDEARRLLAGRLRGERHDVDAVRAEL